MEAVAVMKWGTERAKKKIERQASSMIKRDIALQLRADVLKKERSKLDAGRKVPYLPFFIRLLSLCSFHSFRCVPAFRHWKRVFQKQMRFDKCESSRESKRI